MKKKSLLLLILLFVVILLIILYIYNINNNKDEEIKEKEPDIKEEVPMNNSIKIIINNSEFSASLENNTTTTELLKDLPVTLEMQDLNDNEKYVYLDKNYPTNPVSINTIEAGDIMLFGSNCLVIFYETFNTSYTYTKIGHINNVDNLKQVLGEANVTIVIE